VVRAGRVVLLLLLVRWTWLFLFWPMHQDVVGASFLHLISISFREAGHGAHHRPHAPIDVRPPDCVDGPRARRGDDGRGLLMGVRLVMQNAQTVRLKPDATYDRRFG